MEKIIGIIRRHWPVLVGALIAAVVYWRWLNFSTLTQGDWPVWSNAKLADFLDAGLWESDRNLGGPNLLLWRAPLYWLQAIVADLFGLSVTAVERVTVFWPIVWLLPLSGYLFVREAVGSKWGGFVGSLVIAYNTYFLAIATQGHLLITEAVAVALLAPWAYWRAVSSKNVYGSVAYALGAAAALAISGYLDFRVTYIFAGFLTANAAWQAVAERRLLRATWTFGVIGAFCLGLHFFWIYGTAHLGQLLSNYILEDRLFGDEFWNLPSALAAVHPFWNGARPQWFRSAPVPWQAWLMPLFAWSALLWRKLRPQAVFFAGVALVGIFLAKQADQPFAAVYPWLYGHVPGFNAFREATKFYVLIIIGLATLVGFGVKALDGWSRDSAPRRRLWRLAVGVVSSVMLLNALPLIDGRAETLFVPKEKPANAAAWERLVDSGSGFYRTMLVTGETPWRAFSDNRPTVNVKKIEGGRIWEQGPPWEPEAPRRVRSADFLVAERGGELLARSSVRYLAVDLTADGGAAVAAILDKASRLERVESGSDDLVVYEVRGARPHFWLTAEKETSSGDGGFEPVEADGESDAMYRVRLRGLSSAALLNFSESRHPDWRLYFGTVSWDEVSKTLGVAAEPRPGITGDIQAYRIDPADWPAGRSGLTVNQDGTYDLEVTVAFRPQIQGNFGLEVTAVAWLVLLLGVVAATYRASRSSGTRV
jgi:hypothetical protein